MGCEQFLKIEDDDGYFIGNPVHFKSNNTDKIDYIKISCP